MIRILFAFFLFASQVIGLEEPQRLSPPRCFTVSVIIPCTACHFSLLRPLLERYAKQTALPDEVSISLSNCQKLNSSDIDILEREPWPFQLKIIRHRVPKTAGENRNFAKSQARGNLLIAQDADDIPHPQRVEIVKYAFEHFDIDHLVHSWGPEGNFSIYTLDKIPIHLSTKREIFGGFQTEEGTIPLHNGNVCLSAEFAKLVRWDSIHDGQEDVRFNYLCYDRTKKTALIPLGLIHYRDGFSYFRDFKSD